MATKTFKGRIQNKHDTEANWNAAVNFKPLAGELIIYDEDNTHSTPRFKVGDGNTLVNNLPFYPSGDVTAAGNNTFTGINNIFTNQVDLQGLVRIGKGNSITILSSTSTGLINVKLPSKKGTLALTDDIDVTAAGNNTFTGKILINTDPVLIGGYDRYKTIDFSNYDSIKVGWKKSNTLDSDWYSYTRYADGAIYKSPTGLDNATFTYTFPSKSGTLALTSDIPDTSNFVTLSGAQTISGIKKFTGNNTFTGTNTFTFNETETSGNLYRTLINKDGVSVGGGPGSLVLDTTYGFDNIKRLYGDTTYTYTFPNKNGIFATMNDIPNVASLAKLAQDNTFTGSNTFNNGEFKVNSSYGIEALSIDPLNSSGTGHTGMTTLKSAIDQYCSIALGAGTMSISSTGTNNNSGHIDISTGSNGVDFNIAGVTSALKVLSDGIKVNSKTKYCGGKIENRVSGTTYSLTLPSKSGTLALTNDIPIKTATLSGTTLSITLS